MIKNTVDSRQIKMLSIFLGFLILIAPLGICLSSSFSHHIGKGAIDYPALAADLQLHLDSSNPGVYWPTMSWLCEKVKHNDDPFFFSMYAETKLRNLHMFLNRFDRINVIGSSLDSMALFWVFQRVMEHQSIGCVHSQGQKYDLSMQFKKYFLTLYPLTILRNQSLDNDDEGILFQEVAAGAVLRLRKLMDSDERIANIRIPWWIMRTQCDQSVLSWLCCGCIGGWNIAWGRATPDEDIRSFDQALRMRIDGLIREYLIKIMRVFESISSWDDLRDLQSFDSLDWFIVDSFDADHVKQ